MPCRILVSLLLLALACVPALAADPDSGSLTPWQLRQAIAQKPTGGDLERLQTRIEATFGKKDLEAGTVKPKVEDTMACFAVAYQPEGDASRPPHVLQTDGDKHWDMVRLGSSPYYFLFLDLPNATELNYAYEINGRRTGSGKVQIESYNYGPDSYAHDDVPRGTVTKYEWKSQVFPDTVRDYWVYVPAQYDPKGPPACVMVFQDGGGYVGDQFRTPTVFDNLIHKNEIPVIIGIFINPGAIPAGEDKKATSNRSFEYDSVSDQYARFLRDEILPEVSKKYHLRSDPASRAIGGISSGGICSFTVAWQMPDQFGKVLSHVGSFTNIRGGHVYPALIRKTPKKNLRVYLQDNSKDLNNEHGNWPLANQEMASALEFKGYDYTFVMGPGFHSGKFGGAHLPEELKWLWRDYAPPKGE